jgi:transcriptional regulator with XRE-family HTH domain
MKIKRKQGEVLKEIRKRKDLTQTQLGKMLGVRYNTISGWETGEHKIPTNRLNEICNILNIPPSYLLGEEPVAIEYPYGFLTSKMKLLLFLAIQLNVIFIYITNQRLIL